MRPVDFSCILRVSKSQMLENGTKDTAVDGVYRGVLDYLSSQSHKVRVQIRRILFHWHLV